MSNTNFITTSGTYMMAYFQAMAAGDYTYVASGVNLLGGNPNYGIYDTSYGTVDIAGSLVGVYPVFLAGASGFTSFVQIEQGGRVITDAPNGHAVEIDAGPFNVVNDGAISNPQSATFSAAIYLASTVGAGDITNNGIISGAGVGIDDNGAGAGASNIDTIYNYGQITETACAIFNAKDSAVIYNYGYISSQDTLNSVGGYGGSAGAVTSTGLLSLSNFGQIVGGVYASGTATIYNFGVIQGNIFLGASGSGGVYNNGTINGVVQLANGESLVDSGVITEAVYLNNGTVQLTNAQVFVNGSGDTVNFMPGANNVISLEGAAAWDNVVGSNGTVDLYGALSGVVGGNDTINFLGTNADTVSLWNTTSNWDNISGSNGSVYLNHAITGVVGGGDTVYFNTGNDNIASLWNTNGAWDNVYGSNNTVYLSDAISGVVGGNDAIEFFYGAGDAASLWNTGGAADTVTSNAGVTGTLYINNAQANVIGNGDTIAFTYAGANSVNVAGNYETFIAQPVSGGDSITGYNSTDQIYLSASQFGSSWSAFVGGDVAQSGANTLITDPANHANQITLVGVTASSLNSANFHFA